MPNFNEFNINEPLLDEVRRVKANEVNGYSLPIKKPSRVTTVQPDENLDILEWFEHIKNVQRKKDLVGNIEIY